MGCKIKTLICIEQITANHQNNNRHSKKQTHWDCWKCQGYPVGTRIKKQMHGAKKNLVCCNCGRFPNPSLNELANSGVSSWHWDCSKSLLKGWKIVWNCFFSLGIVLGKYSPDRRLADALRQEQVFPSVLRCSFFDIVFAAGFFLIVIQIVHWHFAEGTMELQGLPSRCDFLCGRRSTFKCSSCKFLGLWF